MIPDGWNITNLETLALVERGKFSARPRNDPRYYGGHIPFVQTGDITSAKKFLTKYTQTLNEEGLKVSRLFPANIILITIAANIGDTAITTFDVACPDSVVAIQPYKDKADVVWLKQALETHKERLDALATQNAQKNINLQVLRPLCLHTPPLPEQKEIAQILSTWDKAIETVEKLIANSTQKKKALMQQLLTGKKRFPSFDGEWRDVRLEDVLNGKKRKGKIVTTNEKKLGMAYIGSTSFEGDFGIYTDSPDAVFCASDDILVLWDGENAGKSATGLTGAVSSTVVRYCIDESKADSRLITYNLLRDNYKVRAIREGSGIPHMPGDFEQWYRLALPLLKEQQKIASALSSADQEIETWQQELEHLKQEKKALMQQLLTGKRRVVV